jgi:hypothetical protein
MSFVIRAFSILRLPWHLVNGAVAGRSPLQSRQDRPLRRHASTNAVPRRIGCLSSRTSPSEDARPQRIGAALAMAALWAWTREGMLLLLLLVAALRIFGKDAPAAGDRTAIFQYLLLLGVLAAMYTIRVPLGAGR